MYSMKKDTLFLKYCWLGREGKGPKGFPLS